LLVYEPMPTIQNYKAIIIDGGPAGLFAAVRLAETVAVATGPDILLLERGGKPGCKLLVSGSGQCNITHRFHGRLPCPLRWRAETRFRGPLPETRPIRLYRRVTRRLTLRPGSPGDDYAFACLTGLSFRNAGGTIRHGNRRIPRPPRHSNGHCGRRRSFRSVSRHDGI